ncbi:glycosyltransferase [Lactobacillus kalixensis]|uniref:glycosyltransferase n=1 Tax=Lactobacillus kalixensis TaxID=227944 RepID=UPI00070FFABC|nr:glycosyltransferase [Lactobacillus kalixensis]
MITKKEIVAIVVLYNPDSQVYKTIAGYKGLVNHVILVDNSSKNNQELFKDLSYVKYIPLLDNLGIAYALNKGIKESYEKYILTMDQDSNISVSLINSYLSFFNKWNRENIGALTCQYNTDRNPQEPTLGWEKVKLSMQSGTLFKRSTFQKIGYFNENLFLDVVDYEYFLRMNSAELQLVRINSAVLDHQPATTRMLKMGPIRLKYGVASPVRYYYQARNLFWTARKYNDVTLYINLLIKWLKILLLFDDKKKYFQYFSKGIKDAKNKRLGKYNEHRK